MSSFFGGSPTTTTKVTPDIRVTNLLKDILNDARSIDSFDFIAHEAATLTPQEQEAINNAAGSGNARAIAGALSPRLQQGIEQATKLNQTYESVANNPITVDEVYRESDALKNGLYKTVQATAGTANNVAGRLDSAAARAAVRRGTNQQAAFNALDPRFKNMAIEQAAQNRKNTLDVAGMQSNLAGSNIQLGMQGIGAGQQATQNQLSAGNLQQAYQNTLFANQQANEQGNNNFIWQKIQNKQNILGNVSNLAGYTIKQKGAAASPLQQTIGAGLAGAGMYLRNQQLNRTELQRDLDSGAVKFEDLKGDKQVDTIAGVPVYNSKPQPSQTTGSFLDNAWTGVKGALSSFY
ncbi:hypothetical protein OGA32_000115 [Salmonella enterica]|nr:hypothetical protein [Salmonella enterica]